MNEQQVKKNTPTVIKLVIFPVGNLNIGISIDKVQKVIHQPHVFSSGLNFMGVTHLNDREVTVIDLHQKLFNTPQHDNPNAYLVVIRSNKGEDIAVVSPDTPLLEEIPLKQIRVLPESYRKSDTLGIASHVALLPPKQDETEGMTVFILEVDRLL